VESFEAIRTRHDRTKGFLVSFDDSSDALAEIGAFFRKSRKVIVALTVREIIDEEIARKLAEPGKHGHGPTASSTASFGAEWVGDVQPTKLLID
jgi:hypothetical protein